MRPRIMIQLNGSEPDVLTISGGIDIAASVEALSKFLRDPNGLYRVDLGGEIVLIPRHAVTAVRVQPREA